MTRGLITSRLEAILHASAAMSGCPRNLAELVAWVEVPGHDDRFVITFEHGEHYLVAVVDITTGDVRNAEVLDNWHVQAYALADLAKREAAR